MNVYFIISSDYKAVKIGTAKNVQSRLDQLQTGNHEKLEIIKIIECESIKKAYFLESGFHEKYKEHRIRGEWFHPTIIFKGEFPHEEFRELRKKVKLYIKLNKTIRCKIKKWRKFNKID